MSVSQFLIIIISIRLFYDDNRYKNAKIKQKQWKINLPAFYF